MMRSKWKFIGIAVSVAFGAVVIYILTYFHQPAFHKAIPRAPKPVSTDERSWQETDGNYLRDVGPALIKFTWEPPDLSDLGTIRKIEAGPDQSIDFGDGEKVILAGLQVSYTNGPAAGDFVSERFDPKTLEPIPDALTPKHWSNFYEMPPPKPIPFPEIVLHFQNKSFEKRPTIRNTAGALMDLQSRTSARSQGDYAAFRSSIYWHSQPIAIHAEFTYGEFEEAIVPLEVGQKGSLENFSFEILEIHDYDHSITGSRSYDPGFWQTDIETSTQWKSSLVVIHLDKIREMPGEFEVVPVQKKEKNLVTSTTIDVVDQFGFIMISGGHSTRFKELKFRKKKQAVGIFKFARIPGLPDENYGLTNAFDATVPYLKLEKHAPYLFLPKATGLSLGDLQIGRSTPSSGYPLVYQNKKLNEIVLDIQAQFQIFKLEIRDGKLHGRKSPDVIYEELKTKLLRK